MALNQDDPNVVFLLFGPSRSGKSSTGNLLLNKNTFSEKNTVRCTTGQERNGRRIIRVVDTSPTPVFSHETDTILHKNREITRSLLLSVYGPRNIIVVLKTDQLPRETAGCIQFLQMMLGNDAMSDINIVFTGTSIINYAAFDMFLNKLVNYPDVRRIIAKCKGKHLALNDGDSTETNRRKVEQLLIETAKPIDKERKEIQLVMTGQSSGGKSKTANNILGENVFTYGTETLGCTVARRSVDGRDVIVVDTPGMNSRVMDNDAILNDLTDPTISLNAPPRIIVPVLRMDRQELSDEERNVLTILQETFPNQITRRLVIIFTRQEEYLKRENSSFDTFLRTSPPELKALLKRSHYRCKGFNNMADITGDENKRQVGALLRMIDDANTELRLVLIGKTGSGKSSTGNTVLGRRGVFANESTMTSLTNRCKSETGNTNSRDFEIVDTPGLFDTRPENTPTTTLLEMARCLTMTVPGPHGFLLALSIADKYTAESKKCIDIIRRTFGDEMLRHTVIIFTNADRLDPGQTPENVITASDISLRNTLEQNNNRWLAFNNKTPTGDEPEKVMEAVEIMLACNEGRHYSSAIYKQVATRLRAYGAGTFADMRAFADNHPWVMLSIVSLLAAPSLFGFGYLAIGATAASGVVMITYERLMGRNV